MKKDFQNGKDFIVPKETRLALPIRFILLLKKSGTKLSFYIILSAEDNRVSQPKSREARSKRRVFRAEAYLGM